MLPYSKPQVYMTEELPRQLLCQSNTEDMTYRDGEWSAPQ